MVRKWLFLNHALPKIEYSVQVEQLFKKVADLKIFSSGSFPAFWLMLLAISKKICSLCIIVNFESFY